MSELSAADVESFTKGRLPDDDGDGETTRMLSAALAAARRHCGWHVSPVIEDAEIVLDGPGGCKLYLPTRKILSIGEITESGTTVEDATYAVSAGIQGLVVRTSGRWSNAIGAIRVTLDHGFTEDEAADWRQAVLSMVDEMSEAGGATGDGPLIRKRVDDVEYQWSYQNAAASAIWSAESVLSSYQLMPVFYA